MAGIVAFPFKNYRIVTTRRLLMFDAGNNPVFFVIIPINCTTIERDMMLDAPDTSSKIIPLRSFR